MFNTCSNYITRRERLRAMRPFYVLFMIYMCFSYALTFAKPERDSPTAWAVDLGAGVSMVAMLIAAAVGLARQRDEFQRKLLTEAIMWGTGGMLAITSIWGLLEVHTSIPKVDILVNFPIFVVITGIAKVALFRRNATVEEA
jgi:hypothetical protein